MNISGNLRSSFNYMPFGTQVVTWPSSVLKEGNEIKEQVQNPENTSSKVMFNAWAVTWHFMILFCSLEDNWLLIWSWIVWFLHIQLLCVISRYVLYKSWHLGMLFARRTPILHSCLSPYPLKWDVTASPIKKWSLFPYFLHLSWPCALL